MFIRFGQAQRNCLIGCLSKAGGEDMAIKLFHWFGSYLLWNYPDGTDEVQRREANFMVCVVIVSSSVYSGKWLILMLCVCELIGATSSGAQL